jgi:NAD(P)-dependent dehydrogenase (short-subunit alcohol dehydrogenase family)
MALTTHGLPDELHRALHDAFSDVELDACIVGASSGETSNIIDVGADAWTRLIARVSAASFVAQHALRDALDAGRPARLIFISAPSAVRAIAGTSLDGIAGAFLQQLGQVIALESGAAKVTANVVVPGWMEGPQSLADQVPMKRFATPHDTAGVCRFLASDAAAYINGAIITVDGGFTISKVSGTNPFQNE